MLFQALGHILPISVAVALSSIPITATILILLSPNRNRSSIPFLIGWVLGLAAVVSIFTIFAQALPTIASNHPELAIGIAQMIVGLALIVFAIISWRRSINKPNSESLPRWLRAVSSLGPFSAFGLALALNIRPKALLLAAAAGLSLRGDNLSFGSQTIAIIVYTVISASTVAVPIIFTLISPTKMEVRLVAVRAWLTRNNRTVTILIMIFIGVVIFADGLTRL
jgi:Sap, sulfolipid-1-addressing protein